MVFRCIIRHDIIKLCDDEIHGCTRQKLNLQQGILEQDLFKEICKAQKRDNEVELIWNYLLKFELAFPLESNQLFIPAIVSKKDKVT